MPLDDVPLLATAEELGHTPPEEPAGYYFPPAPNGKRSTGIPLYRTKGKTWRSRRAR